MSEYQHYEFLAIDRPLSAADQRELSDISSRAEITSRSFVNTYNWGDLGGDPEEMLLRWFDAYLYVSNFGSYQLSFRFPRGALRAEELQLFACEALSSCESGEHLAVHFHLHEEEGGGWIEEDDDRIGLLIPLREALVSGDRRVLYLTWLIDVQQGVFEGDEEEPPVPPGLGALDDALDAFVELMHLDVDLVAAAAEASERLQRRAPGPEDVLAWLAARDRGEKDEWLRQVFDGGGQRLGLELQRRWRDEHPEAPVERAPRTVSDLVDRAEQLGTERRAEAERHRREEERREAERREALRKKRVDALVGREEETWDRVAELVAVGQTREYNEAAELLADLRDLEARGGGTEEWKTRVAALRAKYPKRVALLKRLDGLGA